jgi:hypothetical protein
MPRRAVGISGGATFSRRSLPIAPDIPSGAPSLTLHSISAFLGKRETKMKLYRPVNLPIAWQGPKKQEYLTTEAQRSQRKGHRNCEVDFPSRKTHASLLFLCALSAAVVVFFLNRPDNSPRSN